MPIKQTKPRQGSNPMLYFKGTKTELSRLSQAKIKEKMQAVGAKFFSETHAKAEARGLKLHALALASKMQAGEAKIFRLYTKVAIIPLRIVKTKKRRILIHQMPHTHGIRKRLNQEPFDGLIATLSSSFQGRSHPNSLLSTKRNRQGSPNINFSNGITLGDVYSIEVNAPLIHFKETLDPELKRDEFGSGLHFVKESNPNQILAVNIILSSKLSKQERAKKEAFYKKQIRDQFGVPVKFIIKS